jgi:hypothetical protein
VVRSRFVLCTAKQYHPDILSGGESDKAVDEHFVRITEAYTILSNTALRSDYDSKRYDVVDRIRRRNEVCTRMRACMCAELEGRAALSPAPALAPLRQCLHLRCRVPAHDPGQCVVRVCCREREAVCVRGCGSRCVARDRCMLWFASPYNSSPPPVHLLWSPRHRCRLSAVHVQSEREVSQRRCVPRLCKSVGAAA